MKKLLKVCSIMILITTLSYPSSAFAKSYYYNDWDNDYWDKHRNDSEKYKKDWDGCLRDEKNSSKCIESKDIWHDWYCWEKGDHDHDEKDKYNEYNKDWDDTKKYSWLNWIFLKWW